MTGDAGTDSTTPPVAAPRYPAPDVAVNLTVPVGLVVLASSAGALAVAVLVAAGYLAVTGAL